MKSNERLPTNIGNPQEITIIEFAERIGNISITRRPSYSSNAAGRSETPCPDITKAKRILNWSESRTRRRFEPDTQLFQASFQQK